MRNLLLAGISAAALMFSVAPAHATLTIVGGTAHVTPADGGGIIGNQIIPNTAGFLGGNLSATAGTYEYTFIGFEAGFNDFFNTPGGSFHNQTTLVGTSFQVVHAGGDLIFDFNVIETGLSVLNGANNPDGTHPNFFLGDFADGVYIALDDSGGGPDDNHDDLVVFVREVAIPEPASLALFGAALAGLAFIRRRYMV